MLFASWSLFIRENKKWWLTPIIVGLVLFPAVLLVLGGTAGGAVHSSRVCSRAARRSATGREANAGDRAGLDFRNSAKSRTRCSGRRSIAVRAARALARRSVVGRDRERTFDRRRLRQRCAEFGVLGMPVPEDGGLGLGLSELLAVMEGLGYAMRDQGLLFSMNAHCGPTVCPS